ncbi:hypothetical protein V1264_009265 [Littorina saxatilis]|uniref:Uncharacterized protein n=1 Tax=Littorina saxatilis TaxID=31220 RepID=A0AAN9ARB8_9CAEN
MLLLTLLLMLLLQVTGSMAQDFQAEVRERLAALESQNWYLSRALLLQQVAMEEYRRANGDSGITVIRNFRDGTQPYHSATHTSLSAIAVHNHANTVNTCGLGELDVVLNGVHFRTRHNDFPLAQPSTTSVCIF